MCFIEHKKFCIGQVKLHKWNHKLPVRHIFNIVLKILKAGFVEQVREAIGVTLSIVCSNIRLHASRTHDHSHGDVDGELKEERWIKLLTERATKAVKNIHNSSHSINLDTSKDVKLQNGHSNVDSEDDVKWMETVNIVTLCFELSESIIKRTFKSNINFILSTLFHFCSYSILSYRQ